MPYGVRPDLVGDADATGVPPWYPEFVLAAGHLVEPREVLSPRASVALAAAYLYPGVPLDVVDPPQVRPLVAVHEERLVDVGFGERVVQVADEVVVRFDEGICVPSQHLERHVALLGDGGE